MVTTNAQALSERLGGELIGDGSLPLSRIGGLAAADAGTVSFLAHPRYAAQLEQTQAGCVIVAPALRDAAARRPSAILCADPYLAFARLRDLALGQGEIGGNGRSCGVDGCSACRHPDRRGRDRQPVGC